MSKTPSTPHALRPSEHALRFLAAIGLGLLLFVAISPPAQADHMTPMGGCFDGHDGVHEFPFTWAELTLTVTDIPFDLLEGQSDTVLLSGPTVVSAQTVDATHMDTEIVEMHLEGQSDVFGQITVTQSATEPSLGQVEATSVSDCFPATSYFDVYVDVLTPFPLHNHEAVHMEATLNAIPPSNGGTPNDPSDDDNYVSVQDVIDMYDAGEVKRAEMYEAKHFPNGNPFFPPPSGDPSVGGFVLPAVQPAPATGAMVALAGLGLFLASRFLASKAS